MFYLEDVSLLNTAETAEELDVSIRTIQRLLSRGELHAFRVLGMKGLRFDSDEVARFQAERKRPREAAS